MTKASLQCVWAVFFFFFWSHTAAVTVSSSDPAWRASRARDSCSFLPETDHKHIVHRRGCAVMSPPSRAARKTFSSHTDSNLFPHSRTWTGTWSKCVSVCVCVCVCVHLLSLLYACMCLVSVFLHVYKWLFEAKRLRVALVLASL